MSSPADHNLSTPAAHESASGSSIRDLDFELPEELIAQQPAPARDQSHLLVLDRKTGAIQDSSIVDLPNHLAPGDLLVMNNSKVIPAKFIARRKTGGKVEGLFVRQTKPDEWLVMLQSSGRLRPEERLTLSPPDGSVIKLTILDRDNEGLWHLGLDFDAPAATILEQVGETPLPPYIRRLAGHKTESIDRDRYQTVYATEPGSVAAPTAGLHFTDALLHEISARGINCATVTLHVGLGTFRPIKVERLTDHPMHTEWFNLPPTTVDAIRACRERDARVIAIGTTSARVLESAAVTTSAAHAPTTQSRIPIAQSGETNLFIYPLYGFKIIDGLLTNFHLPRSTLLALVMALAGTENIRRAYHHAIEQRYRFFSYGDAMLIL